MSSSVELIPRAAPWLAGLETRDEIGFNQIGQSLNSFQDRTVSVANDVNEANGLEV